jgi:pectate lyase
MASGGSAGKSAGGTGGSPTVDDQGCPLTLEGFATLEGGTTGGAAGPSVTVSNQADLERYAGATEPYVIRVSGTISLTPAGTEVRVRSNKSIIGLGTNAKINEGGFFLASGVSNVIFRNLTIGGTGHYATADDPGRDLHDWDGIQMDTAHHIWIDHCHFEDVYDGMIDVRMDTNFITLSWNRFRNHLKTVGIGWTENLITKITLHHNFFDNCEKRNPNCDNAYCHSYNNILEGVDEQGSLAYGNASLRIENGVFRNSNRPWYSAESTALVTQTGSLTENIMNSKSNGEAFNARDHYQYQLDNANVLDDLVKRCVGPRSTLGR